MHVTREMCQLILCCASNCLHSMGQGCTGYRFCEIKDNRLDLHIDVLLLTEVFEFTVVLDVPVSA